MDDKGHSSSAVTGKPSSARRLSKRLVILIVLLSVASQVVNFMLFGQSGLANPFEYDKEAEVWRPHNTLNRSSNGANASVALEKGISQDRRVEQTATETQLDSTTRAVHQSSTTAKATTAISSSKRPVSALDSRRVSTLSVPTCYSDRPPSIESDIVCPGCRSSNRNFKTQKFCGAIVRELLDPRNTTEFDNETKEAFRRRMIIARSCQRCFFDACSNMERHLLRFDEAAPRVLYGKTILLSSLPEKNRLPAHISPRNVTEMQEYFRANPANQYPRRRYYSEFNPSIVRLSEEHVPPQFVDNEVVYLASFRLSTNQACLSPLGSSLFYSLGYKDDDAWKGWKGSHSMLGLAFLRKDLSIVAETIVDPHKKVPGADFEDTRLFVLNGQVYMSSFLKIVPLWFDREIQQHVNDTIRLTNDKSPFDVIMRRRLSCAPWDDGKNLNYFYDRSANRSIVELYPMATKKEIDLFRFCNKNFDFSTIPDLANSSNHQGFPSFGTLEEVHYKSHGDFSAITSERGSACCVSITNPWNQEPLWLGISHAKTRFRKNPLMGGLQPNHFFSTFYAFEQKAPYRTVARSGRFCLGFPNESERHAYTDWNRNRLYMSGEEFDCPATHFVSGIEDDATDAGNFIIGYGINDCLARFAVVSKAEVIRMLFPLFLQGQVLRNTTVEPLGTVADPGVGPHFDCALLRMLT